MGVGCKLVQFVAYCVLFVMMSTNVEKNSAVSEERHALTAYGVFSGRKLGQYADQELLKSLFQNKTPDSSVKYVLIQVQISRVSSKNKGQQAKGKNSVKKTETKQKNNGTTRKQKTA